MDRLFPFSDSIYKLLLISGLIGALAIVWFFTEHNYNYKMKVIDLREASRISGIQAAGQPEGKERTEAARIAFENARANDLRLELIQSSLSSLKIWSAIGLSICIFCSFMGAYFWYTRTQKLEDEILWKRAYGEPEPQSPPHEMD